MTAIMHSPTGRFLTLQQYRQLYSRLNGKGLRSPELAAEVMLLSREWGEPYRKVQQAWGAARRGERDWSPAEHAYVRGEIDRVEDYAPPSAVWDPEPGKAVTVSNDIITVALLEEMRGELAAVRESLASLRADVAALREVWS